MWWRAMLPQPMTVARIGELEGTGISINYLTPESTQSNHPSRESANMLYMSDTPF
jgi:hypothetical protein